MKKTLLVLLAILVTLAITGGSTVSAATPPQNGLILEHAIEGRTDCQVLRLCQMEFKKYEKEISESIGDAKKLKKIANEFYKKAKQSTKDEEMNTSSEYYFYVAINLIARAHNLNRDTTSIELTILFINLIDSLELKMKKCRMELPLPIPPSNFFENPQCCKAALEIEIFYNDIGEEHIKIMEESDPEKMVSLMVKIMEEYGNNENYTKLSRIYFACFAAQIGDLVNILVPGMVPEGTVNEISENANGTIEKIIQIMENCQCLE